MEGDELMAVTYGFFDSVNGDRKYSADDISNFFLGLIPNGVFAEPENTMEVTIAGGLRVKVAPGWGFIQCKWIHNDTDLFFTLDEADILLTRIDSIVLRLDKNLRKIEISLKRGIPAESPLAPELQRDEDIWELRLAHIYVPAGTEELSGNEIVDDRGYDYLCGRIYGFSKLKDIEEIEKKWSVMEKYCYYCNGVNDNITLPAFINTWKQNCPNASELKIIGTFGVNSTVTAIDDTSYSMVCRTADITLDFSECDIIQAGNSSFAYFEGCCVRNLRVHYPERTTSESSVIFRLISGRNAILENCFVSGSLTGEDTALNIVWCYDISNCHLIRCDVDFSSGYALTGISAVSDSQISACAVSVTGTDEESVYGVTALNCHCIGSSFKATGENAFAGNIEGNFTECTFTALGNTTGYGFRVTGALNASNCTFKGYTKNTENGEGIGISGNTHAKILLQGISCPSDTVLSYAQTGAMQIAEGGQGFYTGDFYTPPVLPAANTVLTYTDFVPTKIMAQAEYDTITPIPNTLYTLTEGNANDTQSG